jgi:hypothetical protein
MEELIAREIRSPQQIRNFLNEVLQYEYEKKLEIIEKIAEGESGLIAHKHFKDNNTYDKDEYRSDGYVTEDERWALRKQIVEELLTKERLSDDDKISLGNGGALPQTGLKSENQAYIIIGLPASGKSGIADTISDNTSSLIIDSDYAKRKIPEYYSYKYGATLVNKESNRIVTRFTDKPLRFVDIKPLTEICLLNKHNVVVPKIGNNIVDLVNLSNGYRQFGYNTHLVLVNLDRRKATIRAIGRYIDKGRYVPLTLIFDVFGNDPILNYYKLKNHLPNSFDSFGMITTDVEKGQKPLCVEFTGVNPAQHYSMCDYQQLILK